MILDVTIGAKKIYHGWDKKLGDELLGIDLRKGDFSIKANGKMHQWADIKIVIEPTVLADLKHLPFCNDIFSAIIFDPPHMSPGLESWLGRKWGSWTSHETIRTVRAANKEFRRVLKANGFLILKVMPRRFRLYETLLKNFHFFFQSALTDKEDPITIQKENPKAPYGRLAW